MFVVDISREMKKKKVKRGSGGRYSMSLPGQVTTREEIEEMALSGDTFVESDFSPEERLFEEDFEQNGSDADESGPDHEEEDEVSDEQSSYSEDDPTEEEEEEASYLEHSGFYSCDRLARAEDLRPAEARNPPHLSCTSSYSPSLCGDDR